MALDGSEVEGSPYLSENRPAKVVRDPRRTRGWSGGDLGRWGWEEAEVTAYIDVQRVSEGRIGREYLCGLGPVRKAVEDAKLCGLPQEHAEK